MGSCAHMPWRPAGSRCLRAHGRGVARLHQPVGGPLSWGEVGTHHTPGCAPYCLPVSPLHPTAGSTAATRWVDLTGQQVSHAVIARPRPCMGDRLPRPQHRAVRLLPWGKPLPCRAATEGTRGRFPGGPLQIRVAMFAVALALPFPMAHCAPLDPAAGCGRGASRRTAAHRARLQPQRRGSNRPAALDRQALRVSGPVPQPLHAGVVQGCTLLAQTGHDRKTAGDSQHLVGRGQQTVACCLR
jgi:hypothetical protein